jgi:enoyl-CoA hydratase/carnithine racemase
VATTAVSGAVLPPSPIGLGDLAALLVPASPLAPPPGTAPLVVTGERVDAATALAWGLVDRLEDPPP